MTTASAPLDRAGEEAPRAKFVLPGQVHAVREPTRFTTILGSCVSVCLFDPTSGCGGLNHYLLPGEPGRYETELTRWGKPAIEDLLAKIVVMGARASELKAKIVGGAQLGTRPSAPHLRIGERNIETALEELIRHGIPIVGKAVGGMRGRKLIFDSHTGRSWVRDIGSGNH